MAPSTSTKIGHGIAKVLGIKLQYRNPTDQAGLSRGESVFSVSTADTYVEDEPHILDWFRDGLPTRSGLLQYVYNLFPFTHWITRYNGQWLFGDLVAGITVGAVVVPQSMAYAALAQLPVEFGLYSSFMGVMIYWLFATSKDITIGPVAVMSTVTGNVVSKVAKLDPSIPGHVVASALAVIAGTIICFIGLIRAGWIVDFISLTAISAFMTGSALNIAVGQVPAMMGITGFSTRESTYLVVINTLRNLGHTKLDAAMGLTALTLLYVIRSACNFGARKLPNRRKMFFILATLRTAFVILLYTLISWLVNRNHRKNPLFRILGTVPRGFQNAAVPVINKKIISLFASELPATVIVLLIEHIAIAKSFGRVNNYSIDPSQELVAIGVTNLLGPFLGAYPATGSFSRTAIKSKAGVRTPFAGVVTGILVLLAIYALPAVFFYIPNAALSAVIIHAVGDLITPPNTVYQFWRISPLEVIIFFAGVIVTVFSSIENGIYVTISISAAVLLFRVVKARGRFLGKVKIHSVVGDHLVDEEGKHSAIRRRTSFNGSDPDKSARNLFLPIDHQDGSNPQIEVDSPYPGIFIYRFSEGFNYPNANHYLDYMVATIFKETRRTNLNSFAKLGDRPWNEPGPRRGRPTPDASSLPTLKAIILDFSSVNNVDITSVQHLIDVRNQLDHYASPDKVEWHLACINNRWTKRALASAGFGYPSPTNASSNVLFNRWKPVFSVAEIGGFASAAAAAEFRENERELRRLRTQDLEGGGGAGSRSRSRRGRASSRHEADGIGAPAKEELSSTTTTTTAAATERSAEWKGNGTATGTGTGKEKDDNDGGYGKELDASKAYAHDVTRVAVVHGLNRPLFHIDLTSALQSAIANVERREEGEAKGVGTGTEGV